MLKEPQKDAFVPRRSFEVVHGIMAEIASAHFIFLPDEAGLHVGLIQS